MISNNTAKETWTPKEDFHYVLSVARLPFRHSCINIYLQIRFFLEPDKFVFFYGARELGQKKNSKRTVKKFFYFWPSSVLAIGASYSPRPKGEGHK